LVVTFFPRGEAAGGGRCPLAGLPAWRTDGGKLKAIFARQVLPVRQIMPNRPMAMAKITQ
jgi:hypothetical protein